MDHQKKIEWMAMWAAKNGAALQLEGECGFGRECVGISAGDCFPDYKWYDYETYDELDTNGEVWSPEDAYHKSECVAVLGRGENAEEQLYTWLKWFDENGFKLETGLVEYDRLLHPVEIILGKHRYSRMVKAAA